MKSKLNFDLSTFEKIENIIFYDEPILSHLMLNNINYFHYLVESMENSDRFLLFQVEEDFIYEYLLKSKSLKEIITSSNIILVLEQDFNGKIVNSEIAISSSLPNDYLPSDDSYIQYNPAKSSYYFEKIEDYNRKLYLNNLRKNSFYLKFSTNDKKFGDTIGLQELSNTMLKNVSKSYKNFVEIDFEKKFAKIIPIDSKRKSILSSIYDDTDLRMVDLKYGSFEIGLATDNLMKNNIEIKEVKEWADNVGDSYRKIVLDENINEEEMNYILENYSEVERNKIFEPIIKIIQDSDYELKIRNSKEKDYKSLSLKKRNISNKIISKTITVKETPTQDLEIINVTAVIDKNSKKHLINIENSLFNVVDDSSYLITEKDFKKFGYLDIPEDIKIELDIKNFGKEISLFTTFENHSYGVEFSDFNKYENGIKEIIDKIYHYLKNKG